MGITIFKVFIFGMYIVVYKVEYCGVLRFADNYTSPNEIFEKEISSKYTVAFFFDVVQSDVALHSLVQI